MSLSMSCDVALLGSVQECVQQSLDYDETAAKSTTATKIVSDKLDQLELFKKAA